LFTVCPKCTLTLVVTTVDLRAGQGYVRCGRCANVFNALIALREGDPSESGTRRQIEQPSTPPGNPALGSGVACDPPVPEPTPEPDPEPEPEADADLVLEAPPEPEPPASEEEESLEFDAAATDVSEIFVSPSANDTDIGSGSYEAVVLGEEPPQSMEEPALDPAAPSFTDTVAPGEWSLLDDDPAPEESADGTSAELTGDPVGTTEDLPPAEDQPDPDAQTTENEVAPSDPAWVEEMFAEAEAEAERARTAEREALAFTEPDDSGDSEAVRVARDVDGLSASSGDTALEPLLPGPAPMRRRGLYAAGIAVLIVALVLQLLHFNRQSLLLHASFGPTVAKVYAWFGVTLVPRWDLTAYSVRQIGAEAEGAEGTRLRVRLSVQNDSERVQPLPLLRLTLQDRYGNAVATRDLEPREYLPPRAADQRLLEPDQRIDAELHVIDPGKAAIGFEIDACLRAESGAIGCANDARRRAAG
jgi:predicted Zn finger-like uncharacterized protein